ncbi:MAG: hypothetical protein AAF939_20160 [Planctomycetota bacterium]
MKKGSVEFRIQFSDELDILFALTIVKIESTVKLFSYSATPIE